MEEVVLNVARQKVIEMQIEKTIENLKKNNMDAYFVHNSDQALELVCSLIPQGASVAVGGSETLFETGVIDMLRKGKYRFIDRYVPDLSAEEKRRAFIDSFSADVYLTSSNAVTMNGELYNVDGNSNRVAAICYGPKSVIMVVGCNKIVPDINSAIEYVKRVSAPSNAVRLNCDTYCAAAGVCQGIASDRMTAGCSSYARICCNYVVSARQREPGRIKVIIVGENLGF